MLRIIWLSIALIILINFHDQVEGRKTKLDKYKWSQKTGKYTKLSGDNDPCKINKDSVECKKYMKELAKKVNSKAKLTSTTTSRTITLDKAKTKLKNVKAKKGTHKKCIAPLVSDGAKGCKNATANSQKSGKGSNKKGGIISPIGVNVSLRSSTISTLPNYRPEDDYVNKLACNLFPCVPPHEPAFMAAPGHEPAFMGAPAYEPAFMGTPAYSPAFMGDPRFSYPFAMMPSFSLVVQNP